MFILRNLFDPKHFINHVSSSTREPDAHKDVDFVGGLLTKLLHYTPPTFLAPSLTQYFPALPLSRGEVLFSVNKSACYEQRKWRISSPCFSFLEHLQKMTAAQHLWKRVSLKEQGSTDSVQWAGQSKLQRAPLVLLLSSERERIEPWGSSLCGHMKAMKETKITSLKILSPGL